MKFNELVKKLYNLINISNLNKKSDTVVITGRIDLWVGDIGQKDYQFNNSDYLEELKFRLIEISKNSKNLVIIYPVPAYEYSVPDLYLRGIKNWGDTISLNYGEWLEKTEKSRLFLDSIKNENIIRIYPDEIFCNSFIMDECVAAINNSLFYTDNNHLSIEGTHLLSEKIIELLNKNE